MAQVLAGAVAVLAAAPDVFDALSVKPEDVFCTGSSAVVATVIDARTHDCRLTGGGPYCPPDIGDVGLTVRVSEVLSPSADALKVGDSLMVGTVVDEVGGVGRLVMPGSGRGVAAEALRKAFVGKRLVLSLRGDAGKVAFGERWFAWVWPDEAWARATWPSLTCRARAAALPALG